MSVGFGSIGGGRVVEAKRAGSPRAELFFASQETEKFYSDVNRSLVVLWGRRIRFGGFRRLVSTLRVRAT